MTRSNLKGGTSLKEQTSDPFFLENRAAPKNVPVLPLGGCCQETKALEWEGLIIRNRISTGSATSSLDCEHASNNGSCLTPDFLRDVVGG
jgi:hypothetical protein